MSCSESSEVILQHSEEVSLLKRYVSEESVEIITFMTSENYVANTLFGLMQYGRYDACAVEKKNR